MASARGHRVALLVDIELRLMRLARAIGCYDRLLLVSPLPGHHDLMSAPALHVLILARAPLRPPAHLVALASLFEHLHSVKVFDSHELLLEVVRLEVLV